MKVSNMTKQKQCRSCAHIFYGFAKDKQGQNCPFCLSGNWTYKNIDNNKGGLIIDNDMFVKEMQILWQNLEDGDRVTFRYIIDNYFEGKRSERIINKLCE